MTEKKRTAAEQRAAGGGQWGSESVPDLSDVLRGLDIDPIEFTGWLAPRLGLMRAELAFAKAEPGRAEESDNLKALTEHAEALRAFLMPGGLSNKARTALNQAAYQIGAQWAELRPRMRRDLDTLTHAIMVYQRALDDAPAGGRPSTAYRDAFVMEVVGKLRPAAGTDDNAIDLARKILTLCEIPLPAISTIERTLRGA
jgi:hypothetical protein